MKPAKAAVLFSGGKDSCLALFKAKKQGYDIKYLLSVLPSSSDSYMYHKPDIKLLKMQAKMLEIPLITQKSAGKKEEELKDLIKLINKVKNKVDAIIIGRIASNYQGQRINAIAKSSGLKTIAPLWNYSPEQPWNELLESKFKVILTKIAADGLPKEMLGKIIGKEELERLKVLSKKHKFDLSFEGGDAETAILYCPLFKRQILIKCHIKSESEYRHFIIMDKLKT